MAGAWMGSKERDEKNATTRECFGTYLENLGKLSLLAISLIGQV